MKLRDYQKECVEAIWREMFSSDTALFVLPTGCGKTEIIIGLLQKSKEKLPSIKSIFLVNKINLLEQSKRRFSKIFEDVSVFFGKEKSISSLTVASIQSIYNKDIFCNLLIIDEAHNIDQNNGRYVEFISRLKSQNSKIKIVACTATPYRSTGVIYGDKKLFKNICFSKDILWAIENKWLVRPMTKKVPEQFEVKDLRIIAGDYSLKDLDELAKDKLKIEAQIIDALKRLTNRKKCVWACINIAHAEMVCEMLNSHESAVVVHSKQKDRDAIIAFEESEVRHLVFVTIVSEGYDFKPIDAVILMRPTRSPILYVQTIGRGLRPYDGKDDCLVLDYGKVIESCGPLTAPMIKKPGEKKNSTPPMKFCPNCLEYCQIATVRCPACDHLFEERKKTIEKLDLKSYEGDILPTPTAWDVVEVIIGPHISKSGKSSIRIEYVVNRIFYISYSQYFKNDKNDYYFQKAIKKLKIKNYYMYYRTIYYVKGVQIVVEKQGKFHNIKEVRTRDSE